MDYGRGKVSDLLKTSEKSEGFAMIIARELNSILSRHSRQALTTFVKFLDIKVNKSI